MRKGLIRLVAGAAAVGTIAIVASCPLPGSRPVLGDLPECPHSWDSAFVVDTTVRGSGAVVALAGWTTSGSPQTFLISRSVTDIPEFHDCQRLIREAAAPPAYGELGAVFARFQLDSLLDSLVGGNVPQGEIAPLPRDNKARALAEIVSEDTYRTLGIEPGFNCLLVDYRTNGLSARMFAMGPDHTGFTCVGLQESAVPPPNAKVTPLLVASAPFRSIPPAARWEWDDKGRRQLLGVKCGRNHWCTVSTKAMPPVRALGTVGGPIGMSSSAWYDEQYLAEEVGSPMSLTPSKVFASVIPDEALERFRLADYPKNEWLTTAHIALPANFPAYATKLGIRQTSMSFPSSSIDGLNRLQTCIGSFKDCQVPESAVNDPEASGCTKAYLNKAMDPDWVPTSLVAWARILPPGTENDPSQWRYHCVTYRGHAGHAIPAVVRWRWKPEDETIWEFCPAGCCEVHGSPF